jgi:hypothetical protein
LQAKAVKDEGNLFASPMLLQDLKNWGRFSVCAVPLVKINIGMGVVEATASSAKELTATPCFCRLAGKAKPRPKLFIKRPITTSKSTGKAFSIDIIRQHFKPIRFPFHKTL